MGLPEGPLSGRMPTARGQLQAGPHSAACRGARLQRFPDICPAHAALQVSIAAKYMWPETLGLQVSVGARRQPEQKWHSRPQPGCTTVLPGIHAEPNLASSAQPACLPLDTLSWQPGCRMLHPAPLKQPACSPRCPLLRPALPSTPPANPLPPSPPPQLRASVCVGLVVVMRLLNLAVPILYKKVRPAGPSLAKRCTTLADTQPPTRALSNRLPAFCSAGRTCKLNCLFVFCSVGRRWWTSLRTPRRSRTPRRASRAPSPSTRCDLVSFSFFPVTFFLFCQSYPGRAGVCCCGAEGRRVSGFAGCAPGGAVPHPPSPKPNTHPTQPLPHPNPPPIPLMQVFFPWVLAYLVAYFFQVGLCVGGGGVGWGGKGRYRAGASVIRWGAPLGLPAGCAGSRGSAAGGACRVRAGRASHPRSAAGAGAAPTGLRPALRQARPPTLPTHIPRLRLAGWQRRRRGGAHLQPSLLPVDPHQPEQLQARGWEQGGGAAGRAATEPAAACGRMPEL